ncbi:DNA-protecting protein DprA [Rhodoblastus acidophilus]|uniref:DNA-protecting protein DprA n=1 Tax=Rhodoblastus acidophilus TaxID=1074 RepID=A0A6N8DP35_RHOAC|nr:DNA-processing protein DprA [Rhodoblastus acidophilus]MCW2275272.1 DNA processing protein [Rhodoblastus acidophilus]MTV32239.1 DNA-protecting protein DprA [Rhodoblastus acidophilus]
MKAAVLTDEQRLDWLQLIRCENIGPRSFHKLMLRHGSAAAALAALPALIRQGAGRKIAIASRDSCARELAAAQKLGARYIALGEPDYPQGLVHIDAPPPLICLRGDPGVFARPIVAVVGARNASGAGLAFTERLTRGFGAAGFAVVSGLARGIDSCAHKTALASGTIGVLAGGLDRPYPPENLGLIEAVATRGALLSEMPLGCEPRGRDFPRRNRLVSGLALGVVVVEAERRSGTLITARFAREQGRELFAVPGSPLDPRAEGTNDLLAEGAFMCRSAADVVDRLAPLARRGAASYGMLAEPGAGYIHEALWDEYDDDAPFVESQGAETRPIGIAAAPLAEKPAPAPIEQILGPTPLSVDELARVSGWTPAEIRMRLQELELEDRIERHSGDRVSLRQRP